MSNLTIRKLDPAVKERLRVRAAERGHSMEAEARLILGNALADATDDKPKTGLELFQRIHARFAPFGGLELELPSRDEPWREPPKFE